VRSRVLRHVVAVVLLPFAAVTVTQAPASAATISPSRDAAVVAGAVADPLGAALTGTSFPIIPPPPQAECANGSDDDGDGNVDFTPPSGGTADLGCASASDNLEQDDAAPACANGFDDDGDGMVDLVPPDGETPDPGCATATDNNEIEGESDPTPACANGADDDFDGRVDFSAPPGEQADPGCTSATDLDEGSEGLPLDTSPAAVVASPLAGFPTSGGSFGILSSGDSLLADDANDGGGSGASNGGGGGSHGPSFHDLVTLKLDVSVPAGANCLALDFRFLSEEFPEFVGSSLNDGFVAELDTSDFTADEADNSAVVAPHNFAFDEAGKVISINTAGFSADAATGTTYDGATPKLRALTPVTPGSHSVFLSVFDQGDSAYDSAVFLDNVRVFTVPSASCQSGATDDLTPPDTTITSGPSGTTEDSTPTFGFTATEAGSTFQCRIDGGAWESCTTPYTTADLADGAHTFDVRAIDAAGNIDATPASRSFTVETGDTTPPDTTITAGPSGPTNDPTPSFTFTATEAGSTFECRVDGGAWGPCNSPHTTGNLSDGTHTFDVRATDGAGNTDATPASRTFTVDTVAPDTTITAGPSGLTNDSTPTFSFTGSGGATGFQCRVDGGSFTACTSPFTTGSLADGAHTFDVRAVDDAGNTDSSPASRSFTVDTTPPDTTITDGPSGPTTDSTPTFSFTGSGGATAFECRVDAGAFVPCASPFTTAALGIGPHTFEVRASDAAGNVDPSPASRSFAVDTTPPAPPAPPPPPPPTCAGKKATIVGTAGDDEIEGTSGNDVIVGLGGKDHISGGGGHDVICGGDGNDKLDGGSGKDLLLGEAGKDKLVGGGGADELDGGDADDRLLGNGGNDALQGGKGDDELTGAAGHDELAGGGGDDELYAGGGDDTLSGNAGNDHLDGGSGRDQGDGGGGTDVVVRCET